MSIATALLMCSVQGSAKAETKPPAAAIDMPYTADISASTVAFSTVQNGSPIQGVFPVTKGIIFYDPAKPEKSRAIFAVSVKDLAGPPQALIDSAISEDWLDGDDFPEASFTSTSFTKAKNGQYFLEGDLTVKGVTRPIAATVEITEQSDNVLKAKTRFALNRLEFNVGWDDTAAVPADTEVTVSVVARK